MVDEKLIKKFIQSELIKDSTDVDLSLTDNLIETGIIDSLGIQQLIAYLEETFSIQITDDDLIADNFETIEAISTFLRNKMK